MKSYIADSMLGSLAKKLRMLGINTTYIHNAPDSQLKYIVKSEGRILLTRDASLAKQLGEKALLVTGSDTREEFVSIASGLKKAGCRPRPMSRCLKCNGKLATADPESVREKVPPHVLTQGFKLMECLQCGKVYWKGTHASRMDEEIRWMEGELRGHGEGETR